MNPISVYVSLRMLLPFQKGDMTRKVGRIDVIREHDAKVSLGAMTRELGRGFARQCGEEF